MPPKSAGASEAANPYLSPGSVDHILHTFPLKIQLPYLRLFEATYSFFEEYSGVTGSVFCASKCTVCALNGCKTAWLEGSQKTAILLIVM